MVRYTYCSVKCLTLTLLILLLVLRSALKYPQCLFCLTNLPVQFTLPLIKIRQLLCKPLFYIQLHIFTHSQWLCMQSQAVCFRKGHAEENGGAVRGFFWLASPGLVAALSVPTQHKHVRHFTTSMCELMSPIPLLQVEVISAPHYKPDLCSASLTS